MIRFRILTPAGPTSPYPTRATAEEARGESGFPIVREDTGEECYGCGRRIKAPFDPEQGHCPDCVVHYPAYEFHDDDWTDDSDIEEGG